MLRGTAVSPGIARGTAFVIGCGRRAPAPRRTIPESEIEAERRRFEDALGRAESELVALQRDVTGRIGPTHADIFGAQALLVRDPTLHERVVSEIREKHVNAETALSELVDGQVRTLDGVPDPYIRERAADLRDVGRRILSALVERSGPDGIDLPDDAIVVAEELLPSVTARIELGRAQGFVTERGSAYSHTSILARAMGTPAVAGIAGAAERIRAGDRVIVDGLSGVVFVNPDRSVEREYERLDGELCAHREDLRRLVEVPSVTLDGTAVPLLANVNKLADTEAALLHGADGVGLYRTEFQFTIRTSFPTEDDQCEFLSRAAERLHPRRMVLRLLDLGGDKVLPYFPLPPARNPSLAQRGIGLLLEHPDLLKTQLRAFLRTSADHPVSILLPVVRGVEDVRRAREVVKQAQRELAASGKRFDPGVRIGAMIEVPSAALVARRLAREADFLSLGTNDLVQYVLAADREDDTVAASYQPLHPAVLGLLRSVADAASEAGRELTLCGEIAGHPAYTALLLGLGLRAFSVAPGELLEVKHAIRQTRLEDARTLASRALELGSIAEIEALVAGQAVPAAPA